MVGCGGFIGSHLLDALLKDDSIRIDGWDPQVDKISQYLPNPHLNVRRNSLSAADLPEFREAVRAADAVVNLAAICNPSEYNVNPVGVIDVSFLQQVKVVDICAEQQKRLIHFSTSEIYGRTIASYLGILATGVAPPSTTGGVFSRRALSVSADSMGVAPELKPSVPAGGPRPSEIRSRRFAGLGAMPDLHHGWPGVERSLGVGHAVCRRR